MLLRVDSGAPALNTMDPLVSHACHSMMPYMRTSMQYSRGGTLCRALSLECIQRARRRRVGMRRYTALPHTSHKAFRGLSSAG